MPLPCKDTPCLCCRASISLPPLVTTVVLLSCKGISAAAANNATSTHVGAGKAVDGEHERYLAVEASLQFLTERLAAAEAVDAGEERAYARSVAELRSQLEAQAAALVECQLRISGLKEELAAAKQRLSDEQGNEARLSARTAELEARVQSAGYDDDSQEEEEAEEDEGAATYAATPAAAAAAVSLHTNNSSRSAGSSMDVLPPDADMDSVRRHVEGMAQQYVRRLAEAEEELRAVRNVWQQAEAELAQMRRTGAAAATGSSSSSLSSSRSVGDGSIGGDSSSSSALFNKPAAGAAREPSLTDLVSAGANDEEQEGTAAGAAGADADAGADAARVQQQHRPRWGPPRVSGAPHAGADAGHGLGGEVLLQLPSPTFGGIDGTAGRGGSSGGGVNELVAPSSSPNGNSGTYVGGGGSSRHGATGGKGNGAVVAAAAVFGAVEEAGSSDAVSTAAGGGAAYPGSQKADDAGDVEEPDVAAIERALLQGMRSSSPNMNVRVRVRPTSPPSSASLPPRGANDAA
jgi:hypothetical protein